MARTQRRRVFGWTGFRPVGERLVQTREIVETTSARRAARLYEDGNESARSLDIVETQNEEEVRVASRSPDRVFWKPLDALNAGWTRALHRGPPDRLWLPAEDWGPDRTHTPPFIRASWESDAWSTGPNEGRPPGEEYVRASAVLTLFKALALADHIGDVGNDVASFCADLGWENPMDENEDE